MLVSMGDERGIRTVPTSELGPSAVRLETSQPDASRALDRASKLVADRLAGLKAEDLDGVSTVDLLKLACRLELAHQARRGADANEKLAGMQAEELDERIERRLELLRRARLTA